MSKLKFIILYFFILISLVSIIFVALAQTNQNSVAEEGGKNDVIGSIAPSLIFVAVTLFLSHYMDDHDRYARQFRELQCDWYCYKTTDEPSKSDNYKENNIIKNCENNLKNCTLCSVMRNHFGIIDITLIFCFIIAISLLTLLFMQIRSFDMSLMKNIIILVDALLIFQLLSYLKQGNVIARWIKLLQNRKNAKCCEENLQIIFPHMIGRMLTNMRLWFVRDSKKKGIFLDIDSDLYIYIIWAIVIIISIYFMVFKP